MTFAKAIAAFVSGLLVTPLAVLGISPETPIGVALTTILIALFNALWVYLIPNKQA